MSKLKILQSGTPENFLIRKKPSDKVKKVVVSAKEESYITESVKDIKSDELREALEKLGHAVFAEKHPEE